MKTLIQDFESVIENNQIFLAEKLNETGLTFNTTKNNVGACEVCKTKHPDDNIFHLQGYHNKRHISIFGHYLCIIGRLKDL